MSNSQSKQEYTIKAMVAKYGLGKGTEQDIAKYIDLSRKIRNGGLDEEESNELDSLEEWFNDMILSGYY